MCSSIGTPTQGAPATRSKRSAGSRPAATDNADEHAVEAQLDAAPDRERDHDQQRRARRQKTDSIKSARFPKRSRPSTYADRLAGDTLFLTGPVRLRISSSRTSQLPWTADRSKRDLCPVANDWPNIIG
jgi:hypothetical protein